jgi:hypothetical protein
MLKFKNYKPHSPFPIPHSFISFPILHSSFLIHLPIIIPAPGSTR